MPRIYDPSRSDPTVKFIRGAQDLFHTETNKLGKNEIEDKLVQFLKEDKYKIMFVVKINNLKIKGIVLIIKIIIS